MAALLSRPHAALILALLMTALAGLEHGLAPWRPFYVTYALLCIAIPVWIGLEWRAPRLSIVRWILLLAGVVAVQIGMGWAVSSAPAILAASGLQIDPQSADWRIGAALPQAIAAYAPHWDIEPAAMVFAYFCFISLWAGVGEELFYRGYLHEKLRSWGGGAAFVISAAVFATRHAVQLQGADYPWGAAAIWICACFALGLLFSALYEWRRSIWPPVVAHISFNAIPFAQMLSATLSR
jgi:membrane protease YdiL (CAAX protease family)